MKSDSTKGQTFGLIFYYVAIRKRFWLIFKNVVAVALLALIIVFILPKKFTARTVLLPPIEEAGLLSSLVTTLPIGGLLGSIGDVSDEMNKFIAILYSRRMAEDAINKFGLEKRYDAENIELAIEAFQGDLDVFVDEEGMLIVEFAVATPIFHPDDQEEEARQLCAAIVNFVVDQLNNYNVEFETKKAKYNRLFIEKRFVINQEELKASEDRLRAFSETYGIYSLPEQVGASISVLAELETQVAVKEVEFNIIANMFDASHPQYRQKSLEVNALKQKVQQLKNGSQQNASLSAIPAFAKIPELGLQYLRLRRDVEVQNALYEFFAKQYEQIKLQEMNDTPSLQILDVGVAPIRKSAPKRMLIVVISVVTAFAFACIYALIADSLQDFLDRGRRIYSLEKFD